MKHWLPFIWGALMALAALCACVLPAFGSSSREDAGAGSSDERQLEIRKRMGIYEFYAQKVRGLKYKEPVKYEAVHKDELKELFDKELKEEMSDEDFDAQLQAYVKIGLLKSVEGVRELLLDVLSEQIMGFYDPDENMLYVIDGMDLDKNLDAVIYVHELTHALQDQHFGLDSDRIVFENDDDRSLAILSLVEGDATWTMMEYLMKHGNFSFKMIGQTLFADQGKLDRAPYVLQKNLLFPYDAGLTFMTKLYEEKGWEGVNEAFKDLPRSTEQIMHPEKYMGERDDPTEITLPDTGKVLGDGWELLEENDLGELNVQVLLETTIGGRRITKVSEGWDGDRFRVYRNKESGELVLVWLTAWDSEEDASEFHEVQGKLLRKKYPGRDFLERKWENGALWTVEGLAVLAVQRESGELIIEAPTEELLDKVLSGFKDYEEAAREALKE